MDGKKAEKVSKLKASSCVVCDAGLSLSYSCFEKGCPTKPISVRNNVERYYG